MSDNPLLAAALDYAARGWPVLPCHHPTVSGCSCGQSGCASPGKHPATRRGLHDATTDPDQIRRWWRRHPDANVAIRTGAVSGLLVIDLDPPHGPDSLNAVRRGRDLDVLAVRTGSGGTHLYLAHPGVTVPNSAGRLGVGVDVRGDGGYVVAPPSRHATGRHYAWRGPINEPPCAPDWLIDHLTPSQDRPVLRARGPQDSRALTAWAAAAHRRELDNVRHAPEGRRNDTLNRAAFRLGQLAGSGLLDPDRLHDDLVAAAMTAGLTQAEAARTTHSGLHAGVDHPRLNVPSQGLAVGF